jgi:hypothetical protein
LASARDASRVDPLIALRHEQGGCGWWPGG